VEPTARIEAERLTFAELSRANTAQRVASIKRYLVRHKAELLDMLDREGESGCSLARRHAAIADDMLSALFNAAFAETKHAPPTVLAAVGGYGRKQLGLKSDLDVRFVTAGAPESVSALAEAVLYPLWDAGVNIGHQVASIDEMVASAVRDLPTATALLDFRPLAGDLSLARTLQERTSGELFDSAAGKNSFLDRLQADTEERHKRFGDSVYLLEPDVKNGVGALRDADVTWWAARACLHASGVEQLLAAGVLSHREARALQHATDFFWKVRNHLHHRAGRRNDRLTFEQQETLAFELGYQRAIRAPSAEQLGLSVEAFMSEYYRHAQAVMHARERIMMRARPRPAGVLKERDLGRGILSVDGQLTIAGANALTEDPALALRLYASAVARNTIVIGAARDWISNRLSDDPAFAASLRASPEASGLFVSLLCTVRTTAFRRGSILAELHDVGLLVAMIPEFAPLVGRVHHDLYHVYTVDVHSVAAVDRLRSLMRGELIKAHPLACRLAAEFVRPEVLFFATLLHDVGKVFGGREHSTRGAEMARAIMARFELGKAEIEQACHLILHHLTMYFVAARRDLSDPITISAFAAQVVDRETLRELYLLTVADLSTTAPASMTSWKARMLDELFVATDTLLSGPAASDNARLERVRGQVSELCHGVVEPVFLELYLRTMPERYLLANTPAEIAAHAKVALTAQAQRFHMGLVPSRLPGIAQLCVVAGVPVEDGPGGAALAVITGDRPGLLAAIAAAVTASSLEIQAAQIYSRANAVGGNQAVDVFWLRDRAEGAQGVERALPKLERDLTRLIEGSITPHELVAQRATSRWSSRPLPPVPTEVTIDNRTSTRHTVIEVIAQDRPGLLFTLAQVLYEMDLTITVAKVNTEGNRIVDVFYVTELDDTKIATKERGDRVRAGLLAALSGSWQAAQASA
jgi:[protein-PII] uridylyltransferase